LISDHALRTGSVAVPAAPLPVMLLQSGNRDGAQRRSLPRPSPLLLIGFPQQEIVMTNSDGRGACLTSLSAMLHH